MLPIKIPARVPYWDLVTLVFVMALLTLSLTVTLNRRKLGLMLKSLFSMRSRAQLLRETKVFDEWNYVFILLYNFLVQGAFVFVAVQNILPRAAELVAPVLALLLCLGAVVADYFLKMLNTYILTVLFECEEDRHNFNLNKLFYTTSNSVTLLPILAVSFYMQNMQFLWAYLPVFLTTYCMMLYRTVALNSPKVKILQFFLYFCTLEILPYLLIVKLLISI